MEALNYHPSAPARSLRRQETMTIGVLVPQINHMFFGTLAFAIERTIFNGGYQALICSAEEDRDKEDAYIESLLRQRVDGVILVPTGHSPANIERLMRQNVPVVLLDRTLPGLEEVSRVTSDNEIGYGRAAPAERGHPDRPDQDVNHSTPMIQRLAGRHALRSGTEYSTGVLVASTLADSAGYGRRGAFRQSAAADGGLLVHRRDGAGRARACRSEFRVPGTSR